MGLECFLKFQLSALLKGRSISRVRGAHRSFTRGKFFLSNWGTRFCFDLNELMGRHTIVNVKKNEKFTSNCNKLTSGLLPEIFAFSCRKCYCFAYSTKGKLIVMNLEVGIFEKTIKLYYTTSGPIFVSVNKNSKPIKV